MVILEQYPHFLYFQSQEESEQDEHGTWTTKPQTWNYLCRCRIERNGQAQKITTADGKVFQFTATIYMPRNSAEKPLMIGTRIFVSLLKILDFETITDTEIKNLIANGVILIDKLNATFEIGRLHNRLWV